MSLATASASMGGAGGGGIALAHGGNAAMARGTGPTAPPGAGSAIPPDANGPPVSVAALGADLVDKSQLTMKQAKNVSHLPIVALDLYATDPMVASFPPKPKEPDMSLQATLVGKFQPVISFNKGEQAAKTLRKYLTQERTYEELRTIVLSSTKGNEDETVTIHKPHQWMGMKRLENVPTLIKEQCGVPMMETTDASFIAEEASLDGVHLVNGTLDGVSPPKGDDESDRVVYKLRLAPNKKAVTLLPEEATMLIMAVAQTVVGRKHDKTNDNSGDTPLDYPLAVALPAWACHDAAMEAWMDSIPTGGVYFQRSIAALCGALQRKNNDANSLLLRISKVAQALAEAHKKQNDGTDFEYDPLIVMVGVSNDGIECTAVEVNKVQNGIPACLYGNYKVLCNISYPSSKALSKVDNVLEELYNKVEEVAPEISGPVGFVAYGTNKMEVSDLQKKIEIARKRLDTWEQVPVLCASLDCVATGTAVLAAVTHGRLATLTKNANNKARPALALKVHNVAATAVGVRYKYKKGGPWSPVKTVFDFDRRAPAGPYEIECSAAQCAAMVQVGDQYEWNSDELEDAIDAALKKDGLDGKKGIPQREAAALDFTLQVVQKWSRDGEWMAVGNAMKPLTKPDSKDKDKEVGCERVTFSLSVNSMGVITHGMYGELESIVQAVVSSRNSTIRYYVGIAVAIIFFGGFLIRSYWEQHVFQRDTQRLLTYYKHVLPGSIADGDERNAQYLVWRARHKPEVLWNRLEKKYGIAVRHAHEWEDYVDGEESTSEEDEEQDLDEEESSNNDEKEEL